MSNEKAQQVRVRFAPSPTGLLHIGSLRTALFSFLFARHNGGKNILRIEDTDQNRFVEGSVESLIKTLKFVGIEFDEGFFINESGKISEQGEFGPYLQSKRLGLYQEHAIKLIEQGDAYYCFCDEKRLAELRAEQTALKKPPMYDRHCRNLPKEEISSKLAEFKAAGKNPVVRQAIPETGQTVIHDLVYGDILYDHKVLDDQVILKSDGFPTYHLAVVVDDHLMKITHVTRAQEWIPSTPKHILLYKAFGWEPTKFAHFPNILNADKTKLSKRQGDVAAEEFLRKGYLVEALINFIAFLGWNPKSEKEVFSMDDLIKQFDLSGINKAGAVFDIDKLDWMNGLYIRSKPVGELTDALLPFWAKDGYVKVEDDKLFAPNLKKEISRQYLEAVTKLEQDRLKKLSDIGERTRYFFAAPLYEASLLSWKKSTPEDAKAKLSELLVIFQNLKANDFEIEKLEEKIKAFIAEKGFDNGSVLWPLRACLTGLEKSPGPFEIASVIGKELGKEVLIERLNLGIAKL